MNGVRESPNSYRLYPVNVDIVMALTPTIIFKPSSQWSAGWTKLQRQYPEIIYFILNIWTKWTQYIVANLRYPF